MWAGLWILMDLPRFSNRRSAAAASQIWSRTMPTIIWRLFLLCWFLFLFVVVVVVVTFLSLVVLLLLLFFLCCLKKCSKHCRSHCTHGTMHGVCNEVFCSNYNVITFVPIVPFEFLFLSWLFQCTLDEMVLVVSIKICASVQYEHWTWRNVKTSTRM